MPTVYVSGCLSTVGIFTINALLDRGYTVIGGDNFSINPCIRQDEIKTTRNFMLHDTNFYTEEKIFRKYDINAILHLAGRTVASESYKNPEIYCSTNIEYTASILQAAITFGIPRFVFASSSAVYGDIYSTMVDEVTIPMPNSIYGITKYASELLVKNYHNYGNLETISLRYYNIFAPIHYYTLNSIVPLFANKIWNDEPITLYNNGIQRRQLVHIDNIVHANILALETDKAHCFGESFNVSVDDVPITLEELVNILYKGFNKAPNYTLSDEITIGDIETCWGGITKANRLLGYTTQKTIQEGLNEYIEWYKNVYS